ncbi:uncharacterized protein LOC126809870 isoform X2 [Patella vulgata]|uniref:uncharacterized protein LOC126809870 isoform X2 n=1 Tax=Patella vulgata TaxID=6465 RepID=UPI0021808674|nr:uncharacterized protein LOC126809870 isoform X2 [Patella vulgata]
MLLVLVLALGKRCPSNGVPVINMCSNEVKTVSRVLLDINIKLEENINNCTCILQFIQPDTEQTYPVAFTPFYPDNYWCDYSLTVANGRLRGTYGCTQEQPVTYFELKPRETVDMLLKKKYNHSDQVITRCINIQSGADSFFTVSCSLPNNQSPPTVTTTSTITDVYKTPSHGPKTDSNTQEKQVGAIIGGVLGVILVIGGVVLAILVWRCYRAKIPEEDTTYSSLDLQNNINPADVTYQGLQTNLSSNEPAVTTVEVCENRSTNQVFSTEENRESLASNQPTSISQINNNRISNQPTDNNLSATPTYENQSRHINQTDLNPDSGEQILNHQHYENLTNT